MKLQGQKGSGGVSVDGMFYPADADGVVDVPDECAALLAPHGYLPARALDADAPAPKKTRGGR